MFSVAYVFILALFVSTVLVPLLVKVAEPLGMVDVPSDRKVHREVVPRIGGIAIIAGALLPLLLWLPPHPQLQAYLAAVAVLAVFGILDDRFDLDYRLKFLGQFAAVMIVVVFGDLVIRRFPFLDDGVFLPDAVAVPLTIFFVMGVTNAVNLSDGLDGLAGGTSVIAVGALGLLAYRSEHMEVLMVSMAIIGATLGFLRYNTHPARVFMGDSGSQFLGFSAAVLAITVCGLPDCITSPVVPLLILGVPIMDTLTVMVRRVLDGRSPFSADRMHIHHKLLDRGFSQYEAVVLIYGVQLLLALVAVVFAYASDMELLLFYAVFVIASIALLRVARNKGWDALGWHQKDSPVNMLVGYFRHSRALTRVTYGVLEVLVPLFLVGGALLADVVERDFGLYALAGVVVLMAGLLSRWLPVFPLLRLVSFLAAAFVAYLLEAGNALPPQCDTCLHAFYVLMALLVAVWVRLSDEREFHANALDYLIVGIVFLVPNLPFFGEGRSLVGLVAIEVVILFYAIEVLISKMASRWSLLSIGVVSSLALIAIKGLL